ARRDPFGRPGRHELQGSGRRSRRARGHGDEPAPSRPRTLARNDRGRRRRHAAEGQVSDPAAIGENDLHALADGRLDPARRETVEAWLAAHPEDAARVAFYKRLNGEFHRVFDPVLDSPVPEGFAQRPVRVWPRRAAMGAIAASLVAIGLAGGWAAHISW